MLSLDEQILTLSSADIITEQDWICFLTSPGHLKPTIPDLQALRTARCQLNREYETMKTIEAQDLA